MKVRNINERQTLLQSLTFSISSKSNDAANQADNIINNSSRSGDEDYGAERVVDVLHVDNATQQLILLKLDILMR